MSNSEKPTLKYSSSVYVKAFLGNSLEDFEDVGSVISSLQEKLEKRATCQEQERNIPRLKLLSELLVNKLFSPLHSDLIAILVLLKISNTSEISYLENELFLAILDQDQAHYKKCLKDVCQRTRSTPEKIILKLFLRYESKDLLPMLPQEIARVFVRPELFNKIFEANFDVEKISYLSQYGSNDDRVLSSFILGDFSKSDDDKGIVAKVINFWINQDFSGICRTLSDVEKLIHMKKIKRERYHYILVLFHVLSLLKNEKAGEARKMFLVYQNFMGVNTLMRVIDICLDFQAGNIKRTKAKLKQLVFGIQGEKSEIFFRSLAYYWINDGCSQREMTQLKALREEYSLSGNRFMFSEIHNLLKNVLGADALLKVNRQYKCLHLSELFDSTDSWEELLGALNNQKKPQKLVWLVRLDLASSLQSAWCELEPALVEVKSKNKFGTPKIISWQDALKKDSSIEVLSQDRRVLNLLEETDDDDRLSYNFPEKKALMYLAGADNVYLMDEPSQKITLKKRSPEIQIETYEKSFDIQWAYPVSEGELHLEEMSDYSYEVCHLNEATYDLREKFSSKFSLPKDFESLKKFTDSIKSDLVIRGDEALKAIGSEEKSKTEIVCRFNPSGDEYKLEILAQSDWGFSATPGQGRLCIVEKIHGKKYEWHRDIEYEKRVLKQVLLSIDLDGSGECELEIYDRQHLLEILESLHQIAGIRIDWPKGMKISAHKYSSGSLSVNATENKDWFHIEGKMNFGETVVNLSKLLEKMSEKSRFVQLNDNEYLILTEELRTQLEQVGQLVDQREESLLLHAALAEQFNSQLQGVPVDLEEDMLFKDAVTRALYARNEKVVLPDDFLAELRPYQKEGFEWMTKMTSQGLGVCLADDMGLGKTIQTLAVLAVKAPQGPSLVVAPTSLCINWCEEGAQFTPNLNFINYSGQDRLRLIAKAKAGDVFVISYHILIHDIDDLCEKVWSTFVLDEAQMIKNAGTLRSKSIRLIQSRQRIALSGTPLENHTGELWNIFDILNTGLLGNRTSFYKNFAQPIERGETHAIEKLRSRIKPFLLRRMRRTVLDDLPESQESILFVDMSATEKELYDAHRYKAIKNLKKYRQKENGREKKKIEILAEITRLRVAAANPQIADPKLEQSNKSTALLNKLINLAENGHKTLIFSQFVKHLDIIQNLLDQEQISYSRLDGSMNQSSRKKAIDHFSCGGASCMLISLKAGGVGLNLTAADHVIHMDPWWNPAVEDQAAARAVRIGQKNKVNIVRFISKGTIEEDIIKLHENKRNLADDLLRGTSRASKLSVDDLLNLIEKP